MYDDVLIQKNLINFLFNYQLAYFTYGTKDVLERNCKRLDKKIKVNTYMYWMISEINNMKHIVQHKKRLTDCHNNVPG